MLRKILGRARQTVSFTADKSQVEQNLRYIADALPEAHWLALMTSNGLARGFFPAQASISQDRISAMSAAILSLGERIAKELNDGNLHYSLIAGSEGVTLTLVLNHDYVLTIGLNRGIMLEAVLERLRTSSMPLLNALQIEQLPWL